MASSSTKDDDDDNSINDSEKHLGKANKDKDLDGVSSCEEDDSDDNLDSDGLDEEDDDDDAVGGKGLDEDGENSDNEVDRIDNEVDSGDEEGGGGGGGEKEDAKESRESKLKPGSKKPQSEPTSFGDAKFNYTVPDNYALYTELFTNKDKISRNFRDKTLGAEGSEKLTTIQPPRLESIRQTMPTIDKFLKDGGVVGEKRIPIVVPKPKASYGSASASTSGLSKPFTDDESKGQGQSRDQGPQGNDQAKGRDQVNKNVSDDIQVKNRLKTFKEQIGLHASGSGITASSGSPSVSFGSSSFQRPTLSKKFSEKSSSFLNRDLKKGDEASTSSSASHKPSMLGVTAAALNTKNLFNSATPSSPSFPESKVLVPQISPPLAPQVSLSLVPPQSSYSSSPEKKRTAETPPTLPQQKKSVPANNPIQNSSIRNDNRHGGRDEYGHGGRDEDSDDDDDDEDANNGASNNINARNGDAASDQKDQREEEEEEEEDQHEDEDQDEDEEEEEEEETPSVNQRQINTLKSKIWLQAKQQQLASGCKEFPFKISDSLETMTDNLVLYKKYLQLNRNIENSTSIYMLFMALTEEALCLMGLEAEGYAQFQMERIDEYKPCLMALGEKGYFCNGDEDGNVVNPGFQLCKLFALNTGFFMLSQYGSESVKALAGQMSKKRKFEEVGPSEPPLGGSSIEPPSKRGVGQNWLYSREPLADMKQLGFERARTVDEFQGQPFLNKGEDVFNGDTYYINQKPADQEEQEDQDQDE